MVLIGIIRQEVGQAPVVRVEQWTPIEIPTAQNQTQLQKIYDQDWSDQPTNDMTIPYSYFTGDLADTSTLTYTREAMSALYKRICRATIHEEKQ